MKILQPKQRRANAGFSLAELMVVIVIIGLLATMVVPSVVGRLATSKQGIAKTELARLRDAVEQYYIANNTQRLPETLEVLLEPDDNGYAFIDNSDGLMDPWGNPYQYDPGQGNNLQTIDIYSYGRDGVDGGEGEDRDIRLNDDEEQ